MNKIFGAISIAILITATAVVFSNNWPAGAINSWQAKMMGDNKYFPVLTIFIIALPGLLVVLLIKKLLLRQSKK